jgi:hypothetical protein
MEMERQIWIPVCSEILLPDVRAQLVARLKIERSQAALSEVDDPWLSLDDDVRRERDREKRAMQLQHRSAVVRACLAFGYTGRSAHLREALHALEDAASSERQPSLSPVTEITYQREADCFHEALRAVLAPSAVCFLVRLVRAHIHQAIPVSFLQTGGGGLEGRALRGEQWLSRKGWESLDASTPWEEGTWFVAPFQIWYDEDVREARADEEKRQSSVAVARSRAEQPLGSETLPSEEGDSADPSGPLDLPEPPDRYRRSATDPMPPNPDRTIAEKDAVTIHFVEDGFTALGRVWYRGMELTLGRSSPGWNAALDREGNGWFQMPEDEQDRRFGKVMFRPGPWPGEPWSEEQRSSFEKDYSVEGSWEENSW